MKLNEEYHPDPFCICCGREVQEIWSNLLNLPMQKYGHSSMKQTDGSHTRTMGKDYFHESCQVHNCPKCGSEYQEDDVLCRQEAVGEFNGQAAWQSFPVQGECGVCGHVEEFE